METRIITDRMLLSGLKHQWDELLSMSESQGLHLTYEWFLASCEVFHKNDPLHVLIVLDEAGRLAGIAPLVVTSGEYRGVKVRKIGFTANEQSPTNNFILAKGKEEECLQRIIENLSSFKEWDLVDLRKVEGDNVAGRLLKKILFRRKNVFGVKASTESPYILIEGDWQAFWQARSKRFRKSMRNKLNHAQKCGDLALEMVPISNSKMPELGEMREVSSKSWKRTIGEDLLQHKQNWAFYKKISDYFGNSEALNLWILKKQNKAIAFEFHLNCNGVAYPIRADYDQAYRELSPGSILEHHILKTLFEEDEISEYNTCGHTYDYLMNWTDLTRQHENIEFFNRTAKMASLYWVEYKLLPCMRRMKVNNIYHMTRGWVKQ